MRKDYTVFNSSCLYTLAPAGFWGKDTCEVEDLLLDGPADERERLAREGLFVMFSQDQDDGGNLRVVLGELTPQEEQEWIARARGRLRIPCGRLLMVGGCDSLEFDSEDESAGDAVLVKVPPGDYQVEVLGYLPGTAQALIRDGEKPGPWFRRTQPDTPFPAWLIARCLAHGDNDPDFDWSAWHKSLEAEGESIWDLAREYVHYVIHLTPLRGPAVFSELTRADGDMIWEIRRPEICPLGFKMDKARSRQTF